MDEAAPIPLSAPEPPVSRPPGARAVHDSDVLWGRAFGATVTFTVHAVLLAALVASRGGCSGQDASSPPRNVIAAQLVRLGRPPDPRRLPNRHVPLRSTAPRTEVALSKSLRPDAPAAEAPQKRPVDAVDDAKLRRVFERARAFAEPGDPQPMEGSPEGVPEGTVTDPTLARAGDLYATQLAQAFRDKWTAPTVIAEADLASLACTLRIAVGGDRRIGSVRVAQSSGNRLYDDTAVEAVERFRRETGPIPEPPAELRRLILGQELTLRFSPVDR